MPVQIGKVPHQALPKSLTIGKLLTNGRKGSPVRSYPLLKFLERAYIRDLYNQEPIYDLPKLQRDIIRNTYYFYQL